MSPGPRIGVAGPILLDFSLVAPGGSLTHAEGFLAALAGLDGCPAEVLVALPRDPTVLARQELDLVSAGVTCTRIGTSRPAGTWASRVSGQIALPLLARRARPAIVFVAREVGPLLLRRPSVLFAANVLRWERMSTEASPSPRTLGLARIKSAVARRAVGRSVLVIAPTRRIAEMLPEGVRTQVIPLGVDLEAAPPNPEAIGRRQPLQVVALGSVTRHKRVDVIVDLVAALVDRHQLDARLDIWGGTPQPAESARISSRIEERLGRRGALRGHLDPDRRQSMLAEADVFVLGSGTESFGFPLIEAMRTATLVVAPESAIAREACGNHAVYYPEGDPVTGAARLAEALRDDHATATATLVADAQHRSARFTWEACVVATLAALDAERGSGGGVSPLRSRS